MVDWVDCKSNCPKLENEEPHARMNLFSIDQSAKQCARPSAFETACVPDTIVPHAELLFGKEVVSSGGEPLPAFQG